MKILILIFIFLSTTTFATETENHTYKIGEKVELDFTIVTAKTCAEKAIQTQDLNFVLDCPPNEGAKVGYVIFDELEEKYYYIKLGKIYTYQLEELYATCSRSGSLTATAKVVSFKEEIPVIEIIEIYEIYPRPKEIIQYTIF